MEPLTLAPNFPALTKKQTEAFEFLLWEGQIRSVSIPDHWDGNQFMLWLIGKVNEIRIERGEKPYPLDSFTPVIHAEKTNNQFRSSISKNTYGDSQEFCERM